MRAMPATDYLTFHMLPAPAWAAAGLAGEIVPDSLPADGFVHCTTGWGELVDTANRHYADTTGQFLAVTVDLAHVGAGWRYDDAAQAYPHIYGPIPLSAVVAVRRMSRTESGRFVARLEVDVNTLELLLDRLSSAGARLAATRPAVEQGAPWPVGAVASGGDEGEWGPTEVLAHVSEMLLFWLGEMERVLAGPDARGGEGVVPFGRTAADQVRTLTIARDATLPPRELYDRIGSVLQRYRWRLPELTGDDIARRGMHPTRGELAVPDLLERFAISHFEEHAEQLEITLSR